MHEHEINFDFDLIWQKVVTCMNMKWRMTAMLFIQLADLQAACVPSAKQAAVRLSALTFGDGKHEGQASGFQAVNPALRPFAAGEP